MELYKKYRPTMFGEFEGSTASVKSLQAMVRDSENIPHAILFTGPSGCGKTTLARILCGELEVGETDLIELNAADFRGVDMVRDIRRSMGLAPARGKARAWIIDECHQLTKDAQGAFLKLLEDTPRHVYFLLATTDHNKLLKTILSRCTQVAVAQLKPKEMQHLIQNVLESEKAELSGEVMDKLIEVADGAPRKALVLLEQVLQLEEEDDRLECLEKADAATDAINICRALLDPRTKWSDIAILLKNVTEEAETIRHMVLSYASSVILGKHVKMHPRAALILSAFRDDFFQSKKGGLILACWEVMSN